MPKKSKSAKLNVLKKDELERADKNFCKNLNAAQNSLSTMGTFSTEENQNYLLLSLEALNKYIDFCKHPWKLGAWKYTKAKFSKLEMSTKQLKDMDQLLFVKCMKELKHIVTSINNHHVPSKDTVAAAKSLVSALENFLQINNISVSCSNETKTQTMNNDVDETKIENKDIPFLNLLEKATNSILTESMNKKNISSVFTQNLIIDFANAIEKYAKFSQTGLKEHHDQSMSLLSKVPSKNGIQDEHTRCLLNYFIKIKNTILLTFREFHIHSDVVVDAMLLLVCSLRKLPISKKKVPTEGSLQPNHSNATCSMTQPNDTTACSRSQTNKKNSSFKTRQKNSSHDSLHEKKLVQNVNNISKLAFEILWIEMSKQMSNFTNKTFEGFVPCVETERFITQFIDALDRYIIFFNNSSKDNWKITVEMLTKINKFDKSKALPDTKESMTSSFESLSVLLSLLQYVVEGILSYGCSVPVKHVQEKVYSLKLFLGNIKSEWIKSKVPANEMNPKPSCMKKKDTELIDTLRKVQASVNVYSETPSKELQREMSEVVRHLQKCNSSWEKILKTESITFDSLKREVSFRSPVVSQIVEIPNVFANKKDNIWNTAKMNLSYQPPSKSTKFSYKHKSLKKMNTGKQHEKHSLKPGKESKGTAKAKVKPNDDKNKHFFTSSKEFPALEAHKELKHEKKDTGKLKGTNSKARKRRKKATTGTISLRSSSHGETSKAKNKIDDVENDHENPNESRGNNAKAKDNILTLFTLPSGASKKHPVHDKKVNYSEKLVSTVPCLRDTLNRFNFDEIAMTKEQIRSFNLSIANITDENLQNLQCVKNIFAHLKSIDILDGKTLSDIGILVNRFQNSLVGKKYDHTNVVRSSLNENYNSHLVSGNETYLQRCNDYAYRFEILWLDEAATDCELLKLESNVASLFHCDVKETDIESTSIDSDKDDTSDDDWSDVSSNCNDVNNFTIKRDGSLLYVEMKNEYMLEANAPFTVMVSVRDEQVIDMTNRTLKAYDAYMCLPDDEEDEDKLTLQFPDVSSFLLFAQDNQDLVERLNLVEKEQQTVCRRTLNSEVQLSVECLVFMQSEKSISAQVNHLLQVFEACRNCKTSETSLLRDLGEELKTMYRNHELYVFGSRATGQALPDSDIDVYCDVTGYSYVACLNYAAQKQSVSKLSAQLLRNKRLFSKVLGLTKSRVPIVKVFHKPTGMNCDISFKNGSSVENTHLLNVYLQLDSRVPWLLAALKLWAHYNQLNGSRYFTSHGLTWLLLFYLINIKVVPCVMDLQTGVTPKIINNWNVAFRRPEQWRSENTASGMTLLKLFFTWIATTDLTQFCLCTYTGEPIPKASLAKLSWMKEYKGGVFKKYAERLGLKKTKTGGRFSDNEMIEMNGNDGLCVQDPFEFFKNVCKPVKKELYNKFLCLSKKASFLLNSDNFQ